MHVVGTKDGHVGVGADWEASGANMGMGTDWEGMNWEANMGMDWEGADWEGSVNTSANADGGTRISRCVDGVGMVGIVVDGGTSVGASDGVGTVADGGMAHTRAHTFAAADVTSGFARLPNCSPPA